jgi:hypothetical protein
MFEGGIPVGAVLVVDGKIVGRCVSTACAHHNALAPLRTHTASEATPGCTAVCRPGSAPVDALSRCPR